MKRVMLIAALAAVSGHKLIEFDSSFAVPIVLPVGVKTSSDLPALTAIISFLHFLQTSINLLPSFNFST